MANATRYFDTNGATTGFGTLTQAWNTTGAAFWSTSSAGTVATADYTFDNTDTAQFGFTGTTATAGTATIATGVTVTLNQIVTANLAGLQIIAAAGTGTLNPAGTTPTINVGSAGGLTISAPITGTAGFTKAGAGALTIAPTTGTNSGLSGTVSVTAPSGTPGIVALNLTDNALSAANLNIAASVLVSLNASTAFSVPNTISGDGCFRVTSTANVFASGAGLVFGAGQLASMSAAPAVGVTGGIYYATAGLDLRVSRSSTASNNMIATVADLPVGVTYGHFDGSPGPASALMEVKYVGTLIAAQPTTLMPYNSRGTMPSTRFAFYANQALGNPLVMMGGIQRPVDAGSALTFTLAGTNANDNTISGVISSASSGSLGIAKEQAGRWILSGANTYTGGLSTVASGGTIVAKSGGATTGALGGTTGAVTIVSGTTLEIDGSAGNIALTKSSATLTIGGTGDSTKGAIYSYGDGLVDSSNSYTSSSTVLSTATTVQVGAKNTLTMTGIISGAFPLTKSGTGELALASVNSFSGVMTIVGTVSATTLANGGSNSGIGSSSNAATNLLIGTTALTGVLKHTGAAASTNRNWTAGTAGATIDASGSGVLTMTSTTVPAFSSAAPTTITVQGSAGDGVTTFSTYSQPVSNNAGNAVGFTKAGAGAWKLTNATIDATGALTVSGGFLDLNNTARSLSANIVASGGTLQNGSATVTPASSVSMSGGKITANLAGASKTLTVTGASLATVSELAPEATNNAGLTGGTASVNSGTLRLTAETTTIGSGGGKVLGTMAATVANGAAIRTTTGVNQRGQARYQDLTFSSGSSLYIGG